MDSSMITQCDRCGEWAPTINGFIGEVQVSERQQINYSDSERYDICDDLVSSAEYDVHRRSYWLDQISEHIDQLVTSKSNLMNNDTPITRYKEAVSSNSHEGMIENAKSVCSILIGEDLVLSPIPLDSEDQMVNSSCKALDRTDSYDTHSSGSSLSGSPTSSPTKAWFLAPLAVSENLMLENPYLAWVDLVLEERCEEDIRRYIQDEDASPDLYSSPLWI